MHKEIERIHVKRGQAQFQLKERLKRAQVTHPNDAVTAEVDHSLIADDEMEHRFLIDERGQISLDASDLKRIRALFGRKRTHNEQIIVAPCGMILAREIFYAAEAISTVVVCAVHSYLV